MKTLILTQTEKNHLRTIISNTGSNIQKRIDELESIVSKLDTPELYTKSELELTMHIAQAYTDLFSDTRDINCDIADKILEVIQPITWNGTIYSYKHSLKEAIEELEAENNNYHS